MNSSSLSELLDEVGLAGKLLSKLERHRFGDLDLLKEIVRSEDRYMLELVRASCSLSHSDLDRLCRQIEHALKQDHETLTNRYQKSFQPVEKPRSKVRKEEKRRKKKERKIREKQRKQRKIEMDKAAKERLAPANLRRTRKQLGENGEETEVLEVDVDAENENPETENVDLDGENQKRDVEQNSYQSGGSVEEIPKKVSDQSKDKSDSPKSSRDSCPQSRKSLGSSDQYADVVDEEQDDLQEETQEKITDSDLVHIIDDLPGDQNPKKDKKKSEVKKIVKKTKQIRREDNISSDSLNNSDDNFNQIDENIRPANQIELHKDDKGSQSDDSGGKNDPKSFRINTRGNDEEGKFYKDSSSGSDDMGELKEFKNKSQDSSDQDDEVRKERVARDHQKRNRGRTPNKMRDHNQTSHKHMVRPRSSNSSDDFHEVLHPKRRGRAPQAVTGKIQRGGIIAYDNFEERLQAQNMRSKEYRSRNKPKEKDSKDKKRDKKAHKKDKKKHKDRSTPVEID